MSARSFMVFVAVGLAIFTGVAYLLTPAKAEHGKTPLVWTTDPNPQRDPQVEWFNKLYPDCSLSIDPGNSEVMKVIVQSSANMGPDIIGHVHTTTYQTYYDAGVLWDVTEKAKEMGFGLDTLPKSVQPCVLLKVLTDEGEIEERQFAYPCNVYHTYLLYNKNLFDKYDIPYPKKDLTWEEYLDIAKKLTVYDEGAKAPKIFGAVGANLDIIMWGKGADVLNKDGTRCTLNTEEALDAVVFYHSLYHKYGVEPTPLLKASVASQGGWGGHMSWFGDGRVGMLWGARWMLIQLRRFVQEQTILRDQWIKDNPNADKSKAPEVLRLGACMVPRYKDSKRFTTYGARCAAINVASKNRDKALNFLQYLASAEYAKTINDGADSKPGNKEYCKMDLFINPEWPGEEEVHQLSLDSIPYGRTAVISPFITNAAVNRIKKVYFTDEVTNNENLTREDIKELLRKATDRINLDIARNIKREKKLKRFYDKLLQQGAEPIVLKLEEVE